MMMGYSLETKYNPYLFKMMIKPFKMNMAHYYSFYNNHY